MAMHYLAPLLHFSPKAQGNMFSLRFIIVLPLLLISISASVIRLPSRLPDSPGNLTLAIAPYSAPV